MSWLNLTTSGCVGGCDFIIRSIVLLIERYVYDAFYESLTGSYNDITVDSGLRDFVGWAWYDRTFYVDNSWQDKRIILRFSMNILSQYI